MLKASEARTGAIQMQVPTQMPVRRVELGRRSIATVPWSVTAVAFLVATAALGAPQAAAPAADGETIASWSMPDEASLRGRLERWLVRTCR
jgi:hypothetical protein